MADFVTLTEKILTERKYERAFRYIQQKGVQDNNEESSAIGKRNIDEGSGQQDQSKRAKLENETC